MFGRELPTVAPKAGRTERAIITDTLALAGIPEPQAQVDRFLAGLARQVALVQGSVNAQVRPLAGASAAITALAMASTVQRQIRQSVLTGNMRALAVLKLGAAGLGDHLDLDVGAYGEAHEGRAEPASAGRLAAGPAGVRGPFSSATRRWTWSRPWPRARARWASRPAVSPAHNSPRPVRTPCCPT